MPKNLFLLVKKLKYTESAQLWKRYLPKLVSTFYCVFPINVLTWHWLHVGMLEDVGWLLLIFPTADQHLQLAKINKSTFN